MSVAKSQRDAAVGSHMRQGLRLRSAPRFAPPLGAWLFTACVVVAAIAVFVGLVVPIPPYDTVAPLPWIVYPVLFGMAEVAVIHLTIRSQAVTISLSEIPFVLGLFFLPPPALVVSQLVGAGVALVVHRHQPPLKLIFNLAIFMLGTSLGILAMRAIAPAAPQTLLAWWSASFVAVAVVILVSALAISAVISITERRLVPTALRQGLVFGLLVGFVNTSVGLVGVVLFRSEPGALWLLAAPAAVGFLGYRAFSAQRQRQARLAFLHDCGQILQTARLDESTLGSLLARTGEMFRTRTAEVLLVGVAGHRPATRVVRTEDEVPVLEPAGEALVAARLALLAPGRASRVFRAGDEVDDADRAGLERGGAIVPLRGSGDLLGTLTIGDRMGDLDELSHDELDVLETLGSRLGVAIENAWLMEQLAASLAEVTQLADIVESSDDAIVAITADDEVVAWNAAAERLFGYRADEVMGRTASVVLPESSSAMLRDALQAIVAGAPMRHVQSDVRRRTGETVPISIAVSPIRAADGSVSGVSAIVRDETDRASAELAARESARQLRSVIDGSPLGMGIAGEDNRWIRTNPALDGLFGLPAGAAIGRSVDDLVHPDDRGTLRLLEDRLFAGEAAPRSVERRYVAPDGRVSWTNVTARLVHEPSSTTPLALYMIEDITERKRAQDVARTTEERFRRAALAISAVQDPADVLRTAISSACDTLGAEYAAIAIFSEDGSRVVQLEAEGADAAAIFGMLGRLPRGHGVLGLAPTLGAPVRMRDIREHPDYSGTPAGHPTITSFLSVPISVEGSRRAALYVANKIEGGEFTESDEAVAIALANHSAVCLENARVSARALELLADLDRANLELTRANTAKSQFLANVAHELRAPLHAILVSAELVHDPPTGPLPAAMIQRLSGAIQSSGRHMVRLIDDLVDLSRIEAGRLELRPTTFDLGVLLREIEADLADVAAERGVGLEIPEDPGIQVFADAVRLRQILTNLLGNAIKFTDRGGQIRLEAEESATFTRIAVHDTGIGIAADDLERAFLPFEQVSRTTTPGAGLGLAIARSLAELHGGSLEASSTPGVGSTFSLIVPHEGATVARADEGATATMASATNFGHGQPILVVEDDHTAMFLATEILRMARYEVWQAESLAEAMACLDEATPALILLDLRLGDGNGLDLVRFLRADAERRDLPVLVLSADTTPDDVRRAEEAGCSRFAAKPISPPALLGVIHELLASADPPPS